MFNPLTTFKFTIEYNYFYNLNEFNELNRFFLNLFHILKTISLKINNKPAILLLSLFFAGGEKFSRWAVTGIR